MSVADLAKKLSMDPAILRSVDAAGAELLRVNPKLAAAVAARDPAAVMKVYSALGQNEGVIPPSLAAKEKQGKLPLRGTNKPPKAAPPPPPMGGSFDTGTAAYPSLGGQTQITGTPMPPPETISSGTMSVDDFIGRLNEPAAAPPGPASMDELLGRIAGREPPRFPQGIFRAGDLPVAQGADIDMVGSLDPAIASDVSPSAYDPAAGLADVTVRGGERYTGQFGPGRRMSSPEGFDVDPSLPAPEVNPAGAAEVYDFGAAQFDIPEGDGRQLDDLFSLDDVPPAGAADIVDGTPVDSSPDSLGADGVDIAEDISAGAPPAPPRSPSYQAGQGARAAYELFSGRKLQALGLGMLGTGAYQYLNGPGGSPASAARLEAATPELPEETIEAPAGPEQELREMLNEPVAPVIDEPVLERLEGAPAFAMPELSLGEMPNFSQRVEEMIGQELPEEEVLPELDLGPELSGPELARAIRDLRSDLSRGVITPELARTNEVYGRLPQQLLDRSIKYGSDIADRRQLVKYAGMFGGTTRPGGYTASTNLAKAYALLGNKDAEAAFVREYLLGGRPGTTSAFEQDRIQREANDARFAQQLEADREGRLLASNTTLRTSAMAADAEVAKAAATAAAAMTGSLAEVAAAERALQQQALNFERQEQRLIREGRVREAALARESQERILTALGAMEQNRRNAELKEMEIESQRNPGLDAVSAAADMNTYGANIRGHAYDAVQQGMSEEEAVGYVLSQERGAPRGLAQSIVRQYYE